MVRKLKTRKLTYISYRMKKESNPSKLRKTLSTWQLIFYGIGTMLGAGIYVLVGKVAGTAGMFTPLAFLAAAILAGFTAFSYAELSARFPKSGGEVVFLQEGFRKKWPGLVIGWMVVLTGIVSASTIMKGFYGYLEVFVHIPEWLAITLGTLLLAGIAIWGIGESVNLVGVITLIEVSGLVLVVVVAGDSLGEFPARAGEMLPAFSGLDFTLIFSGAFLAFFAYVGFEDLANVAEEAKTPSKSLPIAVIVSLFVASVLYILVALVAVLSLPMDQLTETNAPLAEILAKKGSQWPWLISAISLFAVINGALVQIIMGARVIYGLSEQGLAPQLFSKVPKLTGTPVNATVAVSACILSFALFVPMVRLAEAASFIILSVFVLVNLSLLLIKKREKHPEGVFRVYFWVPALGLILSMALLIFKVISLL